MKFFDGETPHKCVLDVNKKNRQLWKVFPEEWRNKPGKRHFTVYDEWMLDPSEVFLDPELFEI
jgi:hypothetical protein